MEAEWNTKAKGKWAAPWIMGDVRLSFLENKFQDAYIYYFHLFYIILRTTRVLDPKSIGAWWTDYPI